MLVDMEEFIRCIGRGSPPSGWIIDVYNCHGVLKPDRYAGYGNMNDDILKELERQTGEKHMWYDTGYYSIAVSEKLLEEIKEKGVEEKFRDKIENVLNWIVEEQNGGAINWSGFYTVTVDEMEAIGKTILRILQENREDYSILKYMEE